MNLFEIFTFATIASGQLILDTLGYYSSIPCDQFENLNLIENVQPICTLNVRNRFICQLQCKNSNLTPWPLKTIGCKVINGPGSRKYNPEKGKE